MQENTIFIKNYKEDEILPVNENEIWRYAGYFGKSGVEYELEALLKSVKTDLDGKFSYKVCYKRMSIKWENEMPVLPFYSKSKNLALRLKDCNEIILFSATVGLSIDRYIARYQRLSPLKALIANAYGAERIENLCDTFCSDMEKEVKCENLSLTKRYSPGYGDLPIEAQAEIFSLLDCSRQIGVSLNSSLLMSPSKSVTAIIGLKKGSNINLRIHKCSECNNTECEFRKQETDENTRLC